MHTISHPPQALIRQRKHASSSGFTLIELMIAVAVLGLLTALALPAYQKQILKSHRTDAKTALLDLAAREERYRSTNQIYTNVGTALGYSSNFPISVPSSGNPTYTLSVNMVAGGGSFSATATPSGAQAGDGCGSYSITDTGVQSASQSNCW